MAFVPLLTLFMLSTAAALLSLLHTVQTVHTVQAVQAAHAALDSAGGQLLLLWHWFAQPPSTVGGGGGAAAGGGGGAPQGVPGCEDLGVLPMLIGLLAMMYFVLWRPEQKRQKEREAMLGTLKKGTMVRTSGGIRGEIVRFEDDKNEVVLEIAPKTRINILRTGIAGVAGTDAANASVDQASASGNK